MTDPQKQKLQDLIVKYNDVLQESIANALTEDLFNLIIVNGDDSNFELKDFLIEKESTKAFVMKQFMQLNTQPLTANLKDMEEVRLSLVKNKQGKLKLN